MKPNQLPSSPKRLPGLHIMLDICGCPTNRVRTHSAGEERARKGFREFRLQCSRRVVLAFVCHHTTHLLSRREGATSARLISST